MRSYSVCVCVCESERMSMSVLYRICLRKKEQRVMQTISNACKIILLLPYIFLFVILRYWKLIQCVSLRILLCVWVSVCVFDWRSGRKFTAAKKYFIFYAETNSSNSGRSQQKKDVWCIIQSCCFLLHRSKIITNHSLKNDFKQHNSLFVRLLLLLFSMVNSV